MSKGKGRDSNKSLLVRIFTENIDFDRIVTIANVSFDGYTIYRTHGYWAGTIELSVCVEVLYRPDRNNGETFADMEQKASKQVGIFVRVVKDLNRQKTILVQKFPVDAEFENPVSANPLMRPVRVYKNPLKHSSGW